MAATRYYPALKAPGVNLEALARATGVPSKTLRRWRDGKHSPTLRKAELVMPVLAAQLGGLPVKA